MKTPAMPSPPASPPASPTAFADSAADQRASHRIRLALVAAVVLGFAVLIGMTGITLALVSRDHNFTGWVNHTYQVENQISELRVQFEQAETAERGFLITGDDFYSNVQARTSGRLIPLVDILHQLTLDNPIQRRNTSILKPLIVQVLAQQARTMDAARGGARSGPDAAAMIHANQPLIIRTRRVATDMMAEEARLLIHRAGAQGDNAEKLLMVELTSGVLLAVIAAGAFVLVRRYAADLGRSQTALRRLNDGLENEVRRRTADLIQANEEIQRFAYIVSHDLRSPLVNVMGFTSELEISLKSLHALTARVEAEAPHLLTAEARGAVELDLPEAIGFIRSSTQKMDRLINAILKLSREGRRVLSAEVLDMDALLGGVAASLRRLADDRGARIDIVPGLPELRGDRLAVEQVFSNLVENALKYLKPGRSGQVTVSGQEVGSMNVYEVVDNGRGIDPKDHERVFELFRRAGLQDQVGEGIGLAHVKALVGRVGGTIDVQSSLDHGATFRVSLPRIAHIVQDAAA